MELVFQRHFSSTFNETLNYVHVAFVARFKTLAIVKNKPVVLWRDKLVVDIGLAWPMSRSDLWKQNE
jgi:hypothetical protein